MPVRVLQVLGHSAGGIAKHVAQITAALDGPEISVDVAGPPNLPIPMPKDAIPLEIPGGIWGHLRAAGQLRSIIQRGSYNVVHAHGIRAGIDAGRASRGSAATVVTTIHNLVRPEVSGRLRASIYRPAHRLVVRSSDLVLAVSRDIANVLQGSSGEHAGMGKVEVLYLGVGDPPPVTRDKQEVRASLRSRGPLVVTASRLSPQKALHVLIDAIAMMPDDVTAAVLGHGPLQEELRERAQRKNIGDRVHFLGFRDDGASFIAAADVFVLSSVWEGVPLAVQEAILLGTPVVATDVGGMSELITDGVSGRLVRSGDPDALAAAMEVAISDAATAARYVDAARRALAERFSTTTMLGRLREIYLGAGVAK